MTFPSIQFKATNTTLNDQLTDLAQQKFESLEKFIRETSEAVCEVEFEKETNHNSGPIHRVEVNLQLSGKLYRAESSEETFEKAIDTVRNELDKLLRRANKKNDTLFKRGGRAVKEMLQLGE